MSSRLSESSSLAYGSVFQALGQKLDHWSTEGIFSHKPTYVAYALLGTSGHAPDITKLSSTNGIIEPKTFNQLSRVFWEHKLFDTMATFCRFGGEVTLPPSSHKLPNVEKLTELRRDKPGVEKVPCHSSISLLFTLTSSQMMSRGLDEWVPNLHNFFRQAQRHLALLPKSSQNPTADGSSTERTASTAGHNESGAGSQATVISQVLSQANLPQTSDPSHLKAIPMDLTKASAIDIEAALLRRTTARRNGLLVPEILNNLELAAYYVRILLSVSFCLLVILSPQR